MEEVDSILIHSLKSIGCELEDDIVSLTQFTTEIIVDATVRCLRLIKNDQNFSRALPSGMSARYRACTSLANTIVELGYNGELGYQSFLYSNDSDVRKMLIFLVEKIPRAAAESTEETVGASMLLQRSISRELALLLSSPWIPSYFHKDSIVWRGQPPEPKRIGVKDHYYFHACPLVWPHKTADLSHHTSKETRLYQKHQLPLVTHQPTNHRDVAASVLEDHAMSAVTQQSWESEWNTLGLSSKLTPEQYVNRKQEKIQKRVQDQLKAAIEKSETLSENQNVDKFIEKFNSKNDVLHKTKASKFMFDDNLLLSQLEKKEDVAEQAGATVNGPKEPEVKQPTPEELQRQREEEIEALQSQLEKLASQMEKLDTESKKFSAVRQQAEEAIETEKKENEEKESDIRVKRRTVDLLPNADENILKLQAIVENTQQRLKSLAEQWEEHRVPLEERLKELEELNRNRQSETERMLEEMRAMRDKMKELADDTRYKEDLHRQLVTEYERMTKDVNRSAYTRKILEIVSNIKKQKEEINKILIDTRSIQKDINNLQGTLGRTFAVADELIFKDAKKDVAVKRAYKYLAALHENCDHLIETVEETGMLMREIRDLEEQIEQEVSKKTSETLKRITSDLEQVKSENSVLIKQLKEKRK